MVSGVNPHPYIVGTSEEGAASLDVRLPPDAGPVCFTVFAAHQHGGLSCESSPSEPVAVDGGAELAEAAVRRCRLTSG